MKISTFEKAIFNELNKKLKQNMIFLNSDKNWYIVFDKNKLSIENIKLLEDFNKNSLENNNNIYTVYSKDKLKVQENIIKNSSYEKIFTIQSKNLTFLSNSLINDEDIHLISNAFFNFRDDRYGKYFLNKKMHFKNLHSSKLRNFSFLEKINYFLNSTIDISIIEFKETIKESIPETFPIYYAETNLKIL